MVMHGVTHQLGLEANPYTGVSGEDFEFFLTSPIIPCDGWTGGTCIFSAFQCMPDARNDYTNTLMRWYDTNLDSWAPWEDFDGFIIFEGCDFWNTHNSEDLVSFLSAGLSTPVSPLRLLRSRPEP